MSLLLLLGLCLDEETVRVDGPPFLAYDTEAEFEIVTTLEGVTPVWKIADAPGGAVRAVETTPEYSSKDQTIRGERKIKIKSVGKMEGDLRLAITLEKNGRRVANLVHVVRLGPVVRVPAQFRIVEHPRGGTEKPERYEDEKSRKRLVEEVNRYWIPCGIEFEFTLGKPVKGKDWWFDSDGRFHPVIRKDAQKDKSAALADLWNGDDPKAINVFIVRDCHWTEKAKGLGDATIDHSLSGVGMEAEAALFDDSADASTIAHELGHVLGLGDLGADTLRPWERPASERRRLMFSIRKYRDAPGFVYDEMKTSRATAGKILKQQSARR